MDRNDRWFALCTKPRYEKAVAVTLAGKGLQAFLPVYQARRRWSDRIKELELPLFPGYVFCQFDVSHRLPILTTPGVRFIVGAGRVPLPVEDEEVAALQMVSRANAQAEPWPFLQAGQMLRIDAGPLSGLQGILVEVKRNRRLVISVTLLQRSVAVEIDGLNVSPCGRQN